MAASGLTEQHDLYLRWVYQSLRHWINILDEVVMFVVSIKNDGRVYFDDTYR